MKMVRLKKGVAGGSIRMRLHRVLRDVYGVDPVEYVEGRLGYTCIDNVCLIYVADAAAPLGNTPVIYMGSWVAVLVSGELAPSIPLVEKIYKDKGVRAAIIVREKGVKAFLYGNDVLPESIVEKREPVEGLVTVVDSSDHGIVGFAKWDPVRKVYRNIYDLGVYLRLLG
ncbi:hypothetical protein Desmu_0325 [Desulfurococcus mucosus DSM 2162]|uniref:UPF0113 domain-containing protein n=1 Tax=Desulfurococcus mucosus (strain ATCC 35584 / DSM 2162 / JCM 9187 / O7/1) TaxID=765177 RepID=E8R818_DESM0|nr:hypothetical protein Desmu_0325 [Desulfurococcus mucosus DSM 2162]